MTVAGLDAPSESTPLMHRSCNDGVIELSPLKFLCSAWGCRESRSVMCVLYTPYPVVFPTPFSQLDLNPANLEVTLEAEWIMAFLFFRKRHFSVTSQLGHHYVMSWKYWWDILQFFSHTDCQDNSCQKFYKFLGHGVCKRTICTPPWVCLRIIFIHMSNSF